MEPLKNPPSTLERLCKSRDLENSQFELSFVECESQRWNDCRARNVRRKLNADEMTSIDDHSKTINPKVPGIVICDVSTKLGINSTETLIHKSNLVESEVKRVLSIQIIAAGIILLVVVVTVGIVYLCRKLAPRRKTFTDQDNPQKADILANVHKFRREKVQLTERLGQGQFGVCWKAIVTGIAGNPSLEIEVMAKEAGDRHVRALALSELKIYEQVGHHVNVINLIGVVMDNMEHGEFFMITEYCRFGSLKEYLMNNRSEFRADVDEELFGQQSVTFNVIPPNFANIKHQFGKMDLLYWAYQIACGLQYLVTRELIHGNVAARYVLLCERSIIKLSDFAIKPPQDKNRKPEGKGLPLAWMALETIRNGTVTSSSDVWSYGVLLWELFALGEDPYADKMSQGTLISDLEGGYRLPIPVHANEEVYQIMWSCWKEDPIERPNFKDLEAKLKSMLPIGVLRNYEEMKNMNTLLNVLEEAIASSD